MPSARSPRWWTRDAWSGPSAWASTPRRVRRRSPPTPTSRWRGPRAYASSWRCSAARDREQPPVRFAEFLRTTVLISAAAATALAAVTLAGVVGGGHGLVLPIAAGWWVVSGLIGLWLGRRAETSPPIATLLATARS